MSALKIGTILCPVDFSPLSLGALNFAARLGELAGNGTRVVVLHGDLFEAPVYFTAGQEGGLAAHLEKSRKFLLERLEKVVGELHPKSGEFIPLVLDRAPAAAVMEAAALYSADLIVMGTHGRTGFNRFMLGSVAERVLAESSIPVLTVNGAAEGRGILPSGIRRIICPVNFGTGSARALETAGYMARLLNAELEVINVVEEKGPDRSAAEERLCAWVPGEIRSGCAVRTVVRSGDPARAIIDHAGEGSCGLIVLGAERKAFGDTTVMGSTVTRVTRHAKCPVLTLPLNP